MSGCHKPHQRGISLIEVLVSVLLLSVGILGVASLQMYSLKVNSEANLQSQASLQVRDIIEQVRLNPRDRSSFVVNADNCRADNLPEGSGFARQQLAAWCRAVSTTLPGGQGIVTVAKGEVTAEVTWLERRSRDEILLAGGDEDEQTERVRYRLNARVVNE